MVMKAPNSSKQCLHWGTWTRLQKFPSGNSSDGWACRLVSSIEWTRVLLTEKPTVAIEQYFDATGAFMLAS